jgi:hypothetical protein
MISSQLTNDIYFGHLRLYPSNSFLSQERVYTGDDSKSLLTASGYWEYSTDRTIKLTITSIRLEDDCDLSTPEQIAEYRIPDVFETPNFCFLNSTELNYFKAIWGSNRLKALEKVELKSLKRVSYPTDNA